MSKFFEKLSEMELNCSDSSAVNIIGEIYDNEIKLIEREIFWQHPWVIDINFLIATVCFLYVEI